MNIMPLYLHDHGVFKMKLRLFLLTFLTCVTLMAIGGQGVRADDKLEPIIIGLDADLSAGAARGGQAILRGAEIAVDKINAAGGVLGRPLQLAIKDHRGNPARGVDNVEDLLKIDNLVVILGGAQTPVALAELEIIHENKMILLIPWAAGTPIIDNNYDPNFVFRVSVRDEFAGSFLIKAAQNRGFVCPGLLLWRTGWGRSNEKAMNDAMRDVGIEAAKVEWLNSSEPDLTRQLDSLAAKGADVIMLVSSAADAVTAIKNMSEKPEAERLPIISHWSLAGGDFFEKSSEYLKKVDLTFLQTFSFVKPPFPDRAEILRNAYCARYGPCKTVADLKSPVGIAHSYDLVHLLALAIEQADSIDPILVREQLQSIDRYEGVMRNYNPPFTADRHDALDASDFNLSKYNNMGAIIPLEPQ
jgi:branched-chain amino acid transport system substrate-binding protein